MGWMSRFGVARGADPVDPRNESISNGALHVAHKGRRSDPENPAAPCDRPDAHISDEIKRRQIALAVRYVAMVRARWPDRRI